MTQTIILSQPYLLNVDIREYHGLVEDVLKNGTYENNRTKEKTLAVFGRNYTIDLSEGYPLVTTKKMDTFRWDSMLYELEWYLSGQHHIRDLTEKTGIWDNWSDEDNNLPSAYGRFWRRYPIPPKRAQLPGEAWITEESPWSRTEVNIDISFKYSESADNAKYKTAERMQKLGDSLEGVKLFIGSPEVEETPDGQRVHVRLTPSSKRKNVKKVIDELEQNLLYSNISVGKPYKTFDQLKYVVDSLSGKNPNRSPKSRRLIVNAWNGSNAQASDLPPCHYTYLFNLQDDRLNLYLSQRSADVALGVPFNIAAYSALLKIVAKQTGYQPGLFHHTQADSHIYIGRNERSEWYKNNLDEFRQRVDSVQSSSEYRDVRRWILNEAPDDLDADPEDHNYGYDHVPGLLEQLSRDPFDRPELHIRNESTIDNLQYEDFDLIDYKSHGGLRFSVAE